MPGMAREGDKLGAGAGELVLLAVGFGCLIGFTRMFAAAASGGAAADASPIADARYVSRTVAEVATLLLLAAAGWRGRRAVRPLVLGAAALGAALATVALTFDLPSTALVVLAALGGASSAVLMYVWMLLLASRSVRSIIVASLLGLTLAGLIVEGAPLLGDDLAADAVAIAAITAASIAAVLDSRLACCEPDGPFGPADAMRVPWLTVVLLVACGSFASVLYGIAGNVALPFEWEPDPVSFELGTVAVVLSSVAVMVRVRGWMHVVWAPLFALFAIAIALSCVPVQATVEVSLGLTMATVFCAGYLAWAVFPALLSSIEVPRAFSAGVLLAVTSNSLAVLVGSGIGAAMPVGVRAVGAASGLLAVLVAALFAGTFIASRNRLGAVGARVAEPPSTSAESGGDGASGDDGEPGSPADALRGRLEGFASRFGLTPREAEVALYTVQGFSCAYIADKLVVSNSTVRFHQQNIYRKFEVHSRNELIEFVSGPPRG